MGEAHDFLLLGDGNHVLFQNNTLINLTLFLHHNITSSVLECDEHGRQDHNIADKQACGFLATEFIIYCLDCFHNYIVFRF